MILGKKVREEILTQLRGLRGREVAVFCSEGVDSTSLVIASTLVGARVHIYTFGMEDRISTDMAAARHTAKRLRLPCTNVWLPRGLDQLKIDVVELVQLGFSSKTGIECAWPMLYAIRACKQKHIVVGSCADGHFGISKKAMIHFRDSVASLDEYRQSLFTNPDYAQVGTLGKFAESQGKLMHVPYAAPEIVKLFVGRSWEELNKPHEKQTIRDAFPELACSRRTWKSRHTNLQLGDSGIAEHFEILLKDPEWNSNAYKSVVGIYNEVIRREVG